MKFLLQIVFIAPQSAYEVSTFAAFAYLIINFFAFEFRGLGKIFYFAKGPWYNFSIL